MTVHLLLLLGALAASASPTDRCPDENKAACESCLKALEKRDPAVRNLTACALQASGPTSLTGSDWYLEGLKALKKQKTLLPLYAADLGSRGLKFRSHSGLVKVYAFMEGQRWYRTLDERDLVTAATAPVDLALIEIGGPHVKEVSKIPRSEDPNSLASLWISVNELNEGKIVACAGVANPCQIPEVRAMWWASVRRISLEQEPTEGVREWVLELVLLHPAVPSPEQPAP